MGQREIVEILEESRRVSQKWWSRDELIQELQKRGHSYRNISANLLTLMAWDLVEWKGKGMWKHVKLYRGKKLST